MNYLKYSSNIKKAVDYIEKNLKNNATYSDAAEAAGMSKDNFWRVFKKIFKDTVTNYIRGRKMTLIARRIVRSKEPISRIFMEYGYESHEAITRAFKRRFKMTPARYRKNGKDLYFLEVHKLTGRAIKHLLGSGFTLEPKKEKVTGFNVYGKSGLVIYKNALRDSVKLLKNFLISGSGKKFDKNEKIYGIIRADGRAKINDFTESSRIEVAFGVKNAKRKRAMKKKRIPPGIYAHFIHRGKIDLLETTYDYIFGNWLRSKKNCRVPKFFFERAENRLGAGNSFKVDIFVPLKI